MKREIPVAAAVIFNDAGQVLIAQRSEPEHLKGLWEFPGGKIEDGETAEFALRREIDEELAMTIQTLKFIGEFPLDCDSYIIRIFAYTTTAIAATFEIREHLDVRWVWPKDLSSFQLAPADLPIISVLFPLNC